MTATTTRVADVLAAVSARFKRDGVCQNLRGADDEGRLCTVLAVWAEDPKARIATTALDRLEEFLGLDGGETGALARWSDTTPPAEVIASIDGCVADLRGVKA